MQYGWHAWKCPQMLWCQFDYEKVPAGITFLPSQFWDGVDPSNHWHVTKWQFVASMGMDSSCDENSPWEVICEDLSGTKYKNKSQGKGCFAGKEVQAKYRCFGIRVLEGIRGPRGVQDGFEM